MKKPRSSPLLIITLLFSVFITGYFLGRNLDHADIQVSTFQSAQKQYQQADVEEHSEAAEDPSGPVSELDIPVNINTATLEQLQTLPGIGETTAQKIIDYRTSYGPFSSVTQLIHVDGIGEKKLSELIEYISVQEEIS